MNFSRRHFVGAAIAGAASMASSRVYAAVQTHDMPGLLPRARAALEAHSTVRFQRDRVALVDFSRHSSMQRLQIVDLAGGRVLASYLVAHGRGSDPGNSGWVHGFSNRPGSHASADGSYLTGDTYIGKHGRSRRLQGLDPGNSRALERAIVIHGAGYVSEGLLQSQGRIGRSQGCFAVSEGAISGLLDQLGPGRLLFAAK